MPAPMKLTSLEAFCTAVEERSISAAARKMFLSQPSLSDRIADLEREAGVALLVRTHEGVTCTAEGQTFYERARAAVQELKELEALLGDLRTRRHHCLRFGAATILGEHLVPEWLCAFQARIGEVNVELLIGNNADMAEAVRSGRVPLALVAREGDLNGLDITPLFAEELVVIVAPSHPWNGRRIELADLYDQPFISRQRGSSTREVVERVVAEAGMPPLTPAMELGSATAIKEGVQAGLGFSIISRVGVQRELQAGALCAVAGFAVPREWVVVQRPGALLSVMERELRDHMTNVSREFAETADAA